MGMFDTVVTSCPVCGAHNEIQTKAGDCELKVYSLSGVPVDIAKSLDGQTVFCIHCTYDYKIYWPKTAPRYVRMEIGVVDEDY